MLIIKLLLMILMFLIIVMLIFNDELDTKKYDDSYSFFFDIDEYFNFDVVDETEELDLNISEFGNDTELILNFEQDINLNSELEENEDLEEDIEPNSLILEERNVVTVVKGGKIRRKRLICITTDLENTVGLGISKDENSMLAFYKAKNNSFNNLNQIPITYNKSIPHLISSKFAAANLIIIPGTIGTGIIAPYFLKAFLYCCGINNIITKQFGSSSILNNSIALIKAFKILNRLIWHSRIRSQNLFIYYKKLLK